MIDYENEVSAEELSSLFGDNENADMPQEKSAEPVFYPNFNLKNHIKIYNKMAWAHKPDCLCQKVAQYKQLHGTTA